MPSARRSSAVIAIVAIALTMLVTGTADAGIVIPRDDATVIDGPTVAQEGPSVVIEWSMPKRFGLPQTNAYVRNSAGWKVTVTTCGSYTNASGVTITGSSWILYDKGVQLASSTTCKKTITLPHLGFYDVKGTIRTSNGGTYTAQRRIELKDHLIVVAGDSMASGEGNPDVKGDADISWCGSSKLEEQLMPWSCVVQMIDLITNNPSVLVEGGTPSTWLLDPDCHRSYKSGLSLAAKEIEDSDPHSSVTYLNTACSGAETKHMWSDSFEGRYSPSEGTFEEAADSDRWDTGVKPPQADQIRALVCGATCDANDRTIDAVFLSMGINDLDFADLLTDCAKPEWLGPIDPEGCEEEHRSDVEDEIDALPAKFDKIDERFAALGLRINSVYHALYPTDVFSPSGDGCGFLRFVNGIEKSFLDEMNVKLNSALPRGSQAHYNWSTVWRNPKTKPWYSHGYCANSERWMLTISDSLEQYNGVWDQVHVGAMHPNAKGHALLQREFVTEYRERSRPATREVEVTFEAVRALDISGTSGGSLTAGIARRGTDGADRWGRAALVMLPDSTSFRSGNWTDLGLHRATLRLKLNSVERLSLSGRMAVLSPPVQVPCPADWGGATTQRAAQTSDPTGTSDAPETCLETATIERVATATHTSQTYYGTGVHTMQDPLGRWEVKYRVQELTCPTCAPIIAPMEVAR